VPKTAGFCKSRSAQAFTFSLRGSLAGMSDGLSAPQSAKPLGPTPMIARLAVRRTRERLAWMVAIGVVAAVATGLAWSWEYAPLIGWAAAATTFSAWVWLVLGRLDADQTQRHSTAEDPSRAMIDTLLLLANVASLAAVVVVLVQAAAAHGAAKAILAALAVLSVALSWVLVQTLYTLRYASLFYAAPIGGIDFNQDDPPTYEDFAYLSFTLGMTYQVSDTNLSGRVMRATVLRHSLLSYLFGSVILASTINLVVGLSGH
jgi:uncharacterized membrane protein